MSRPKNKDEYRAELAETFAPLCTKVQSIVTAESFDDLNQ